MPFWKARDQKPATLHSFFQSFRYRPLTAPDEIRVLEVSFDTTSSDTATETPKFSLKHTSLISPTGYTAVSYMWGSRDDIDEIVIDDRRLHVRADLKSMLLDLGRLDRTRYLWIDAVCVNQDDTEERSAQVKLMGDIYSRANYVIAYLKGTNHPTYDIAYKRGRKRDYLDLYSVAVSIGNAVAQGDPKQLKTGLDYARFFNNDYFMRRWIIQEICLARSVIIRCDGYELSMGILERYFTLFGTHQGFAESRAARICALRRQISDRKSKTELLLYKHEQAICSDRLDKVYALLSLSETGTRHIPVDYNIRPLKLLVELMHTAFLHEQMDQSRILSFACFLRQHLEITAAEVGQAMCHPRWLDDEGTDRWLLADVQIRSVSCDISVDADVEDGLNRLKQCLPPLRHYRAIRVQPMISAGRSNDEKEGTWQLSEGAFLKDGVVGNSSEIDALDLYTFSITYSHLPRKVRAGLSTCLVDAKDEVWQFARTRVALIARQIGKEYAFVGRALMFDSKTWEPGHSDGVVASLRKKTITVESILDWVRDDEVVAGYHGKIGNSGTRTIAMKSGELLGLMRSVDTFAD